MSTVPFYRAFEDAYRGDRALIKQRLRAYTPFLQALAALPDSAGRPAALDLGCGRGEWLELLGEHGLAARGVDLDAGMLAACYERGLHAEQADALSALRACADRSLALVSAFHLVEHIPFEVLQQLIAEALRVLQPGGLLIMETPNPENLSVGATSFYLDPSHEKPLPPLLLGFLADYAGFGRQRTVRLQEPARLHAPDQPVSLIDVLENVSPDYAIIAQKAAAADVLAAFADAWQRDYGYSLGALALRFEQTGATRLAELHQLATRTGSELVALNQLHAGVAAEVAVLNRHAARTEQRLEELQRDNQAVHQQVLAMLNSRSWKLTAPYRAAGAWALRMRAGLRPYARNVLLRLLRAIMRQPLLNGAARRVLQRFPRLSARLRGLLYRQAPGGAALPPEMLPADGDLSPRAARLYQELKHMLEARKH